MQVIRASSLLGYREFVDELGGDGDALLRAAGINPRSVLTRACRRWFGMTPTGYREASGAG